jgi:hypothetical protein
MSLVADLARLRESSRTRRWSDFSSGQRAGIIVLGSIELALTATAAVDLYKRPQTSVRGPKAAWWPMILVQPIGPVAYLLLGRR